jgi:hypothetical protein
MSTEDCKALLVKQYPHTLIKEWKRESKFKNVVGTEIRVFKHPTVGQVFVNESRAEIGTDPQDMSYRKPSSFTAQEFYFSITMSDGEEFEFPATALVSIVHKPFFDTEGLLDEVSLETLLEPLLPKDIECYEEMDAVFAIHDELSFEELQAKFIEAGFCPSEALDNLIRGQ